MLRLLLFLAFHLLSLAAYAGLAAPLGVNNAHHVLGGNEVTYRRDPQGQWTIDDVSGPVLSAQFQVSAGGTSFGYTRDVIWLRIVLAREDVAPEQWSLEVTNPFINDLQLFTPRGGEFAVVQAGDRFPFASRQIAFHHPVFQVALPTTKQHTFYLRMSSDSSLSSQLASCGRLLSNDEQQFHL